MILQTLLATLALFLTAPTADAEPLKARLALPYDAETPFAEAVGQFVRSVNQRFGEAIDLEVVEIASGALDGLQEGSFEFAAVPTFEFAYRNARMSLFDLPFFFLDIEEVITLESSYVGHAMLGSVESNGVVGLAYWNFGMNRLFTTATIGSALDIAQLHVWTTSSNEAHRDAIGAMGAHSMMLASEDQISTLTATYDSIDLSPVLVANDPGNVPARQILDAGFRPLVSVFAANPEFWDSLSYQVQRRFADAAKEAEMAFNNVAFAADKEALALLEEADFQLSYGTSDWREQFRVTASDAWSFAVPEDHRALLQQARLILAPGLIERPRSVPQRGETVESRVLFATDRLQEEGLPLEAPFSNRRGPLVYGEAVIKWDVMRAIGAAKRDMYRLESVRLFEHEEFWRVVSQMSAPHGKAILFVHGYANSFNDAVLRASALSVDLNLDAPIILYSWPADGVVTRYARDEETVGLSLNAFHSVAAGVVGLDHVKRAYMLSHSMGARFVTSEIATLIMEGDGPRSKEIELIFAAPDVNAIEFEGIVKRLYDGVTRTTLYASDSDVALRCSALFHGGYDRAGQEGDELLVMPEIDTVDVTALAGGSKWYQVDDCIVRSLIESLWGKPDLEHSYVFRDRRVIGDLHSLIAYDQSPHQRFALRQVYRDELPYWVVRP